MADDPNGYPTVIENATADRMARYLVAVARSRQTERRQAVAAAHNGDATAVALHTTTVELACTEAAIAGMLRLAAGRDPQVADDLARYLLDFFDGDGELDDLLYEWAVEYGQTEPTR